jgi:predicted mannosyl-3-phosphoglycerate phosphatase (HAD superfamily)
MDKSFRNIKLQLISRVKLIMTDVDGTLLASGRNVSGDVAEVLSLLQLQGITIGLVSGRTLIELETMSDELGMKGPIIAENGGVARLSPHGAPLELGYTRQPAMEALSRLKKLYPGAIHEREDNRDRTIDIVFRGNGIPLKEIRRHIGTTQLLDSGYITHLMQAGISKGKTLMRILSEYKPGYRPNEVMVFGDSATDLSLFELFPNNVLIINPNLPDGQEELMREKAAFMSELEYGEGFTEVALHIINLLKNK